MMCTLCTVLHGFTEVVSRQSSAPSSVRGGVAIEGEGIGGRGPAHRPPPPSGADGQRRGGGREREGSHGRTGGERRGEGGGRVGEEGRGKEGGRKEGREKETKTGPPKMRKEELEERGGRREGGGGGGGGRGGGGRERGRASERKADRQEGGGSEASLTRDELLAVDVLGLKPRPHPRGGRGQRDTRPQENLVLDNSVDSIPDGGVEWRHKSDYQYGMELGQEVSRNDSSYSYLDQSEEVGVASGEEEEGEWEEEGEGDKLFSYRSPPKSAGTRHTPLVRECGRDS